MRQLLTLSILCLFATRTYALNPVESSPGTQNLLSISVKKTFEGPEQSFRNENYLGVLEKYETLLESGTIQKVPLLKKIALSPATLINIKETVAHIEKLLLEEFNPLFLLNKGLSGIQESNDLQEVSKKYTPKMNIWSFFYLYVALIGFYIAFMLNLNKKIDYCARILISVFLFIHSIFILHICLNVSNYHFQYPHTYLMSTSFSFMYGPLLYFYFKRITQQYQFKKTDLIHLIPTALFIIYAIPIYSLSSDEKRSIIIEQARNGYIGGDSNYIVLIVALKLISLVAYGYFIRKFYLRGNEKKAISAENKLWQKRIYQLHVLYVISYTIYGVLIGYDQLASFIYHVSVVSMALMVLYIGYSANLQPNVFSGVFSMDNRLLNKYEKSGLTESLSRELKEQLIRLFSEEKIFKESDINLATLAERLNTTRHNTSQVINEHFQVGFNELVNKYRIREAKKMLHPNFQNNLNIIDVAYEVGYNNKVTFNKAFKRETQLTPSQFQKVMVEF